MDSSARSPLAARAAEGGASTGAPPAPVQSSSATRQVARELGVVAADLGDEPLGVLPRSLACVEMPRDVSPASRGRKFG
jgi:hypothetical protein